jgi:hypothetical protein
MRRRRAWPDRQLHRRHQTFRNHEINFAAERTRDHAACLKERMRDKGNAGEKEQAGKRRGEQEGHV